MSKISLYLLNLIDKTPNKLGLIIQAKFITIFNYLFTAAKKTAQLFLLFIFMTCFSSPLIAAVYYVDSENGSDTASGLSENSAWQTLDKVNSADLKAGDTVKFARGGLWRGSLKLKSGASGNPITYTCFGPESMPKPKLYGSRPLNNPSDWENAGANLWRTVNPVSEVLFGTLSDVGNLIFDGKSAAVKCWSKETLISDNDFWFDMTTRKVWLYSAVNPAQKFNSIEAALRSDYVVNHANASNVVVSDFDVRYGAVHGFGGGNSSFITIRNCDISWIGGGQQMPTEDGNPVRAGNGIEFWENAHDNLVEGCRIWEIYDAALSNQGAKSNVQRNITYRNNIIWNSEYSYEYFNNPEESVTDNIVFTQNVCYNAGYGWGHSQRPPPSTRNGHHIMIWSNRAKTTGLVITDNVFAYASESLLWNHSATNWREYTTLSGNIWLQHSGRWFMVEGLKNGYNHPIPIILNKPMLSYDHVSIYQLQISTSGKNQVNLSGKQADIQWSAQYDNEFEKFSANAASAQVLSSQDLVLIQNLLPNQQLPSAGHVVSFNHTLQTNQAITAGIQKTLANNNKTILSLQYLGKATVVYWKWDALGNKEMSSQEEVQVYRTVKSVDAAGGTEIKFPVLSADGQIREGSAYIPAAAFKQDVIVSVKQEMALPEAISNVTRLTHSNLGIIFTAEGNVARKTITLKIPYNAKDIENLDEDTLLIARYDEEGKVWMPVKSTIDKTEKFVTAKVDTMAVFAIMGTEKHSGLKELKYYPNPLRPSKGLNYSRMHFINLPEGTVIKIFTILGQTVRELKADGSGIALWDGKNGNGDSVASGVYIAYIEDKSGNKKKIKIAVER